MKLKSIKWTDKGYKVAVVQTEDSENEVIFYMKFVKPGGNCNTKGDCNGISGDTGD
jgi:hypothetical protein